MCDSCKDLRAKRLHEVIGIELASNDSVQWKCTTDIWRWFWCVQYDSVVLWGIL